MLEQLDAGLAEKRIVVGQFLGNGLEEMLAFLLENLDRTDFFRFFFGIFAHICLWLISAFVCPACLNRLNAQASHDN